MKDAIDTKDVPVKMRGATKATKLGMKVVNKMKGKC
jgi:hypothetical protein